jgi:cellulose synthase/poly-beta-1,6-N-acetylglucosamine synthase-like glycosyltransferase
MTGLEWTFWGALFVVFYAYLGYGIVLYAMVKVKSVLAKPKDQQIGEEDFEPEVALIIPAYNEKDDVGEKVRNSFELDYPKDKLRIIFVTDGSDDGTPDVLKHYDGIEVMHKPEREGKIAAINRVMPDIKEPFTIYTDANAMLSPQTVRTIIRHYRNPYVGAVAGEKRIRTQEAAQASAAGEGLYWKYESRLKTWDSELNSVVGAAGELFSIRTSLFQPVERDTLLDDFMISLRISQKGYKVVYEPEAYAQEYPSQNVSEELKRKVRICAGGIQSIVRLKGLLNPLKYGLLSFQYVSHRVLRWSLAPISLLLMAIVSLPLMMQFGGIYTVMFALQCAFYLMAVPGWILEHKHMRVKLFFVPYYFFIMNLAVFLGFFRYMKGQQSVLWVRAERAKS